MKRHFLCLFGLACLMAMGMFATTNANALTPLANTDQPLATLAIQPAPIATAADNVGTQNHLLPRQ